MPTRSKFYMKTTLHCSQIILLATLAAGASAQPRAGNQTILEEVIVTAERREMSLQDTAISISAMSAGKIEELGINNVLDISAYMPNVTIHPLIGGRAGFAVNIRGVRQGDTIITQDPAIGMYLDGVLIAKNAGALLDLADPERIEVLRGPQGTLYGRNTIGGAINVITQKPGDELAGKVAVTAGNNGHLDLRGTLNLPLLGQDSAIGKLNARLSLGSLERDGLYSNNYDNAPQDEIESRDREIALLHVAWSPSDRLDLLYTYDKTKIREDAVASFTTVVNTGSGLPAASLLEPWIITDRPTSGSFDADYIQELDVDGHSLNIDFQLSENMTLTSISAYREMDNVGGADADGSPLAILWTADTAEHEQFTQEFRLVGTALDSRLDYVLGAFYMDEKGQQVNGTLFDTGLLSGLFLGVPFSSAADADFDNEIWALYLQGTYALTDQWKLTAGIRYTEEDRQMSKVDTNNSVLLPAPLVTVFPEASNSFQNTSPMLTLSYDWSDDVMTYGTISRGYQSGGFNSRDSIPADFARGFDEENLTAYELGMKSLWAEGRVKLNIAAFFSDYTDKQTNVFDPGPPPRSNVRNAGEVEIYGFEVEFLARPIAALELGLDYGYTHPEYTRFENPSTGADLTDSNFPLTPENSAHASLLYEFPALDLGSIAMRLDWTYQDEVNFLVPTPEANTQEAYSLWDARLMMSEIRGPADSRMQVALWGRNLADKEYWAYGVDVMGPPSEGITDSSPLS